MTKELLQEALRHARICRTFGGGSKEHAWLAELGREIERLRAENAQLRAASEPSPARLDTAERCCVFCRTPHGQPHVWNGKHPWEPEQRAEDKSSAARGPYSDGKCVCWDHCMKDEVPSLVCRGAPIKGLQTG